MMQAASQNKTGKSHALKAERFSPRYFRILLWVSLAIFLGWLIWGEGFYTLTRHGGFALRDIEIYNVAKTPQQEILGKAGFKRGESIFAVNLKQAKSAIDALPWVQQSHIVRVLPGSIHIYITEHRPAAIWQNANKELLIAHDGNVIESENALNLYENLPIITGERAPESFHLLLAVLEAYPELEAVFTGAKISHAFRWTLYLNNGSQIKLPGKNIDEAFVRLRWLDEQFNVLSLRASVIDLRTTDRAAIGRREKLTPVALSDV